MGFSGKRAKVVCRTFQAARPSSALKIARQLSSCDVDEVSNVRVTNVLCGRVPQLRRDGMPCEQGFACVSQISSGCCSCEMARGHFVWSYNDEGAEHDGEHGKDSESSPKAAQTKHDRIGMVVNYKGK